MNDNRVLLGYVRVPGGGWVRVDVPADASDEERKQAALDALASAEERAEAEADPR